MLRRGLLVPVAAMLLVLLTGCTPEEMAAVRAYLGINEIRTESGQRPLTPDPLLARVAQERSNDMAANDYFSHFPPDGCNFACLIDRFEGVHGYAGENLAWNLNVNWENTARVAVEAWRNSPPHLENIMDCHYERFGTGVTRAPDNKIYFAMVFEGYTSC